MPSAYAYAYAFALPPNQPQITSRLVEAVPSTWSWVDGQLDVPLDALSAAAGYLISRFHDVTLVTLKDRAQPQSQDWVERESERAAILMDRREAILELVAQQLPPLFVRFQEAGFDQDSHGVMPFESAKQIARSYVERGYLGDLFFHSNCYDNNGACNPEKCDLHLAPYEQWFSDPRPLKSIRSFTEIVAEMAETEAQDNHARYRQLQSELSPGKPHHPALIYLAYYPEYGGKEDNLDGLLGTCRELGLTELDAATVKDGRSFMRPTY